MWKLLWQEILVYTMSFLMISMVNRVFLTIEQQMEVEKLVRWCREQSTGILKPRLIPGGPEGKLIQLAR